MTKKLSRKEKKRWMLTNSHLFFMKNGKTHPIAHLNEPKKILKWARMQKKDPHIGDETVNGTRISTVFLGTNHNFCGRGPAILFETMIFPDYDIVARYRTVKAALRGHRKAVQMVRERAEKEQTT